MIHDKSGERILKRMYHRSIRYTYAGSLVVMINSVIDGMIISHFLGGQAAAAFGLVMPFYSLMNLIPTLLRYSTQTRIGEYLGRGDTKAARHSLFVLMITGIAAAVPLIFMLSVASPWTLKLLTAGIAHKAGTVSMASDYMLFLCPAVLPIMLCSVLHPIMQLDGDMRRSPEAIWICAAVNISSDLICVLIFGGGMGGIALATDISCFTELFILLLHYRRKECLLIPAYQSVTKNDPGFLRRSHAAANDLSLFSGGLPFMLRELTAFLSGILINRMAFELAGEKGVSVLCVGNTIWLFLLPAAMAVSSSGTALGSVAGGESDHKGVKLIMKWGLWYAFVPGSLLSAFCIMTAGPLAAFCSGNDSKRMIMTIYFLKCLAVSLPFTIMCQALSSYFTVKGWKKTAVITGIMEGGVMLAAVSSILSLSFGIKGIWAARPVTALFISLTLFIILKINESIKVKEKNTDRDPSDICSIENSMSNYDEVIRFSEQVREFCLNKGINHRLSGLAALTVEELACNTLQWGYDAGKSAGVDIRAVYDEGHLTLRFRDSAKLFDPLRYTQQFMVSDHDPTKNIGLRIVSGLALDMRYACVADCNIVLLKIC